MIYTLWLVSLYSLMVRIIRYDRLLFVMIAFYSLWSLIIRYDWFRLNCLGFVLFVMIGFAIITYGFCGACLAWPGLSLLTAQIDCCKLKLNSCDYSFNQYARGVVVSSISEVSYVAYLLCLLFDLLSLLGLLGLLDLLGFLVGLLLLLVLLALPGSLDLLYLPGLLVGLIFYLAC